MGILTLRKYIRKALNLIMKKSLVFVFRIIGPPRVLRYGSPINVALLKAFGADLDGNNIVVPGSGCDNHDAQQV